MNSEIAFSDHEFSLLARLVHQTAGITLSAQKKEMLRMRIGKRLRALEESSFLAYFQRVQADPLELTEMINAVATNVTHFFREEHHFRFLATVLPELADRHGPLRLWSAGCATGEEPYSLAITTEESLGAAARDCRILASDISTRALQSAAAGIYSAADVAERLDKNLLHRYFQQGVAEQAGQIRVRSLLQEQIRFRQLNLLDEHYPFSRLFHVIFCRNVMIYFDPPTRLSILARMHRHLVAGGYLFLGHSETLVQRRDFVPAGLTVFRKV